MSNTMLFGIVNGHDAVPEPDVGTNVETAPSGCTSAVMPAIDVLSGAKFRTWNAPLLASRLAPSRFVVVPIRAGADRAMVGVIAPVPGVPVP